MGPQRDKASSARRPALSERLSIRCHLPGQRKGSGRDDAKGQYPCHADPIWTRSAAPSHAVHTLCSSWIAPDGTSRQNWRCQTTSPSSCCHRDRRNSTRWRMSGSTCARTGSQTASLRPTLTSSTQDAPPGTNSSHSPTQLHQSVGENGRTSVRHKCRWYHFGISRESVDKMLVYSVPGLATGERHRSRVRSWMALRRSSINSGRWCPLSLVDTTEVYRWRRSSLAGQPSCATSLTEG